MELVVLKDVSRPDIASRCYGSSDSDEKGVDTSTPGGNIVIINESGLYSVILVFGKQKLKSLSAG